MMDPKQLEDASLEQQAILKDGRFGWDWVGTCLDLVEDKKHIRQYIEARLFALGRSPESGAGERAAELTMLLEYLTEKEVL